jgi:outer membrane lipoprotein-sorting protein
MKTSSFKPQAPEKIQTSNSYRVSRGCWRSMLGAWCFSGIWMLVLGAFATSSVRAAETVPVLQKFLAAQTNLNSWSADLTQIRRLKTLTQPLISTGHVWFAAPNKFRWEIGSPAQTIAVRGSDEMLVIYPRLKRVEKYPLAGEKMGQWKDTLALLEAGFPRSQTELDKQFKVISIAPSNDVNVVTLQPRSSSARRMMPQITIAFATNDFQLRSTELQFGDGSTMRNEFRDAELNPALETAVFAPKLDADFKVVEPMKQR